MIMKSIYGCVRSFSAVSNFAPQREHWLKRETKFLTSQHGSGHVGIQISWTGWCPPLRAMGVSIAESSIFSCMAEDSPKFCFLNFSLQLIIALQDTPAHAPCTSFIHVTPKISLKHLICVHKGIIWNCSYVYMNHFCCLLWLTLNAKCLLSHSLPLLNKTEGKKTRLRVLWIEIRTVRSLNSYCHGLGKKNVIWLGKK